MSENFFISNGDVYRAVNETHGCEGCERLNGNCSPPFFCSYLVRMDGRSVIWKRVPKELVFRLLSMQFPH
jgi:hypothetical protein